MLLDPRNGPDWDLPPRPSRRTYVVASLPRTGSTLLCRALWDTGLVGAPKEYLNPMQIRDWEVRLGSVTSRVRHRPLRGPLLALVGRSWSRGRLEDHVQRVMERRTGPGGWFGLKLHRHHLERWVPDGDLEALLGPIRWIFVTREDHVAQAVSWYRALQTGRWASHQRALLPPIYDRRGIEGRLRRIREQQVAWERLFEERGIAPLRVTYEALDADLVGEIRRVLTYLEVPHPQRLPAPGLARQADPVNAAWIRRFRAEAD